MKVIRHAMARISLSRSAMHDRLFEHAFGARSR